MNWRLTQTPYKIKKLDINRAHLQLFAARLLFLTPEQFLIEKEGGWLLTSRVDSPESAVKVAIASKARSN